MLGLEGKGELVYRVEEVIGWGVYLKVEEWVLLGCFGGIKGREQKGRLGREGKGSLRLVE